MKYSLLFLMLCWPMLVIGQIDVPSKTEVEIRIAEEEFPEEGLAFVNAFQHKKKLKYYKQNTSGEISFEAKFDYQGRFFSVAFFESGLLKDIEVVIQFGEISPEISKERIVQYFEENFQRHKLIKVQKQWSHEKEEEDFDADDIQEFFEEFSIDDHDLDDLVVYYEIEISGKTPGQPGELFECLFDEKGKLVSRKKIVLPGMENIIF